MVDPLSKTATPRRPPWAKMPPAPMIPKSERAPGNPFAYGNKGTGLDWRSPSQFTWNSPQQDADFKEEDVKRDDEGKFAKQAGTSSVTGAGGKPYRTNAKIVDIQSVNRHVYLKDEDGNVWGYGTMTGQMRAHPSDDFGSSGSESGWGGEGWKKEPGGVLKQGSRKEWLESFNDPDQERELPKGPQPKPTPKPEDFDATESKEWLEHHLSRYTEPYQSTRAIKGKYKEKEEQAKASGEKWDAMSSAEKKQWFKDHPNKSRILDRKSAQPYDDPYMLTERSDGKFVLKNEWERYGGSQDPYFSYGWRTVSEHDTREAAEKALFNKTDPATLVRKDKVAAAKKQAEWEAKAPEREKRQREYEAREAKRKAAAKAREKPLTPELEELDKLKSKLDEGGQEFAQNLIDYQKKHGKLTPGQQPWIQRLIDRAKEGPAKLSSQQEQTVNELGKYKMYLDARSIDAAESMIEYVRKNQRFASEKQENYFNMLHSRAVKRAGTGKDATMTGWASPSQDEYQFREEDVKRDKGGKFAKQGGTASAESKPLRTNGKGKHPGKGYSDSAHEDERGVIHTDNVGDAQKALAEGRKVSLDQPRTLSTLIDSLADYAERVEAYTGEKPNLDLCDVTVRGSNLFCQDNVGIPRAEMPQVPGNAKEAEKAGLPTNKTIAEFVKDLDDRFGAETTREKASHLRATQTQLDGSKISGMMQWIKRDNPDRDIVISRDNYVLDGHHFWAAKVGTESMAGRRSDDMPIKVHRINLPILDLVDEALKFTGGKGRQQAFQKRAGEDAWVSYDWSSDWRPPHWGEDRNPFSEDNVNRDSAGKWAAQRQLPRARDRTWKSPRHDNPGFDERNLIEDARIKAYDMARRMIGRDSVRIASDRAMAFDRAFVGRELRSQVVRIAMDFVSNRSLTADGHLRVANNRISRASVNPYLGSEIPGSEELGLLPRQKYMLLRHPDELAKAASTFQSIPVLIDHRPISADDHPHNLVVGTTGSDVKYQHPFLMSSLSIWDKNAIDAITSGERKEISCAYHYLPDMTPGIYEGKRYDGIMRDIQGNHVALVPDGRVGPSATVADSMPLDLAILSWFDPR